MIKNYYFKKFAARNPIYGDNSWLGDALSKAMGNTTFDAGPDIMAYRPDWISTTVNPNEKQLPIDPDNLFIAKNPIQAIKYKFTDSLSPFWQQLKKDKSAQHARKVKLNKLFNKLSDIKLDGESYPGEQAKIENLIKQKTKLVELGEEQLDRLSDVRYKNENSYNGFLRYVDRKNDQKVSDLLRGLGYGAAGLAAGGGLVYLLHKLLSKKKKNKKNENKVDENIIKSELNDK